MQCRDMFLLQSTDVVSHDDVDELPQETGHTTDETKVRLNEMRAECAETKVAAESKLSEVRCMMEEAQKKFVEAETKLCAAESSEAEAIRYHRTAERKLHELEAHEDDLRRRIVTFNYDCDAKEKDILFERQSLEDRKNSLQQLQEKLLDGQSLLNQREDYIFNRSQELAKLKKELQT